MNFEKAVEKLNRADKVLIVSHYDCDGLCSAKILLESVKRAGKQVEVRIAKEISPKLISEVKETDSDLLIFSDFGSGYLSLLPKDKEIVVLDHHAPEDVPVPKNIEQVNPIPENKELCGAGVCYLFSLELDRKNTDLIDFAVVGAIGDNQVEIDENKKIKEEAIRLGRLKTEKGLKIFGHVNRLLHESLRNANIFPLNNDSHVVQFLHELKIDLRGNPKSYCDLTKEEKERLVLGIIKERIRENIENPADIFSDIYLLAKQPKVLSDALEFSTILNAFGRLEKFDDALELMSGNLNNLDKTSREYRRKIASYLGWVNRNLKKFRETEDVLFINAGDKIDANMIGTVTSIFINSMTNKKIVVGLAESEEGVKISSREKKPWVDLNQILTECCEKLGGLGGGHKEAAGGKIKKGQEEEFIERFIKSVDLNLPKN